jgi:hypothetical protein
MLVLDDLFNYIGYLSLLVDADIFLSSLVKPKHGLRNFIGATSDFFYVFI